MAVLNHIHVLQHEVQLELDFTEGHEKLQPAAVIPFPKKASRQPESLPTTSVAGSIETHGRVEWSQEGITLFRKRLLHESLRQLADRRVSIQTRMEIIEWVKSDVIEPFSFVVCVRESGFDVNALRDRLNRLLTRFWKSTV